MKMHVQRPIIFALLVSLVLGLYGFFHLQRTKLADETRQLETEIAMAHLMLDKLNAFQALAATPVHMPSIKDPAVCMQDLEMVLAAEGTHGVKIARLTQTPGPQNPWQIRCQIVTYALEFQIVNAQSVEQLIPILQTQIPHLDSIEAVTFKTQDNSLVIKLNVIEIL